MHMKHRMFILLVALFSLVALSSAYASVLKLPAGTERIEEEAFYGDRSLDEVVLPDGIKHIGNRAFAYTSLKKINIPDSVEYLGNDAFAGTTEDLEILFGSYGNDFDQEHQSGNLIRVYNGHKYQLIHQKLTWDEADQMCRDMGGHLVTITTAEEQAFITSFLHLSSIDGECYWIGLSDSCSEGNWYEWVNGEAVVYTNWGRNEPDNGGSQDFGAIYTHEESKADWAVSYGQWDDLADTYLPDTNNGIHFCICEWDPVPPLVSRNGHTYRAFLEDTFWETAEAKCEDMGGHLVTIQDPGESQFLLNYLLKYGATNAYWMGLHDGGVRKDWKWVTGEATDYFNWGPNNPNYYGSFTVNHGAFYTQAINQGWSINPGQWDDTGDVLLHGYVCEWEEVVDQYVVAKILSADYVGTESGLDLLIPFSHKEGRWVPLTHMEEASVTVTATKPEIRLYRESGLDNQGFRTYEYLRTLYYDEVQTMNDGSLLYVFHEIIDPTGTDRSMNASSNICGWYLLDAGDGSDLVKSYNVDSEANFEIGISFTDLVDQNTSFRLPEWDVQKYVIQNFSIKKKGQGYVSPSDSVFYASRVAYGINEYLFYEEKNGNAYDLGIIRSYSVYFSDTTFRSIVPWKILITPASENDFKMTVSLKSNDDSDKFRPKEGTYRVICSYHNDEGAVQYSLVYSFTYDGSTDFSRETYLIRDRNFSYESGIVYEFIVVPTDEESHLIALDDVIYGDFTYEYMFEDSECFDESRYYAALHQYMVQGVNPLDDSQICDYLIRRMCSAAMQKNDALNFVRKLKLAPPVYRNLYLESIADYSLGNLYTQKPLFSEPAYAYYQDGVITIMDYAYTKYNLGGVEANITVFHESGHAIDWQDVFPVHNSSVLYDDLVLDLKDALTSELEGLGYSSSDIRIILDFLVSSKDKNTSAQSLISSVNASRKKLGIATMMKMEDYDELRENLYSYINGLLLDAGDSYLNALLISDISAGLMNNKVYHVNSDGSPTYLSGHFSEDFYWYNLFGFHTDNMCSEAWAEWFACKIADIPAVTKANEDFYPRATAYLDSMATNMLKYYIAKHTQIDVNRIRIDTTTGGFNY